MILVYAVSIRAFKKQFQDPLPSRLACVLANVIQRCVLPEVTESCTDAAMLRSSSWLENFNIDIKSLNILLIDFPNNKGEPCNLWVPARHFAQVWTKIESNLKQFESYYYICRRSTEGPDAFGDRCCSLVSFVPSPKRSRLSHSHLQQAVVHRKSVHWNRLQSRASMSKVKTRRNRKARRVQSSLQDTELSWHQVTYFTFQDHGFLARGAVCWQFATGLASSTTSDTGYAIHFIGSSADGKLTVALFECKMSMIIGWSQLTNPARRDWSCRNHILPSNMAHKSCYLC